MRADIHDGQERKRSVQGPDTEAQDLSPPNHHFRLAMRGRSIQSGQSRRTSAATAWPDVRFTSDSVAKVGRVARLGPFFEFLIVGFAFPSGKTDKPPPSTLTPRMLLALAAHDRGIWPTASSSVPLRSAAPRPWRHSSLVVGVDRV